MEMKYGRFFKLKNGEKEYIEISDEYDSFYERDRRMDSLKNKVWEYHKETEDTDEEIEKIRRVKHKIKNGLNKWEIALLIALCSIYASILQICPMWLKVLVVFLTILWTVYCYRKDNQTTNEI